MITRHHRAAGVCAAATWSPCGRYRYALTRDWGPTGRMAFVMLNPSTATEARNDPTVARCENRARAMGFGGLAVVNLFALCATDPRDLRACADPVGPGNDAALRAAAQRADMVICAWGVHGAHLGRAAAVLAMLRAAGAALHHLGLTQAGHPRHPLYVANAVQPRPWPVDRAGEGGACIAGETLAGGRSPDPKAAP